jgi:hypothetical protein
VKLVIKKEELESILDGKASESISVIKYQQLASSSDSNDYLFTKVDVFSIWVRLDYNQILSINSQSQSHITSDTKTLKDIIHISLMGKLEDIEIEYLTTQEERDKKLNNIGL